jgi:hypothetical protein
MCRQLTDRCAIRIRVPERLIFAPSPGYGLAIQLRASDALAVAPGVAWGDGRCTTSI